MGARYMHEKVDSYIVDCVESAFANRGLESKGQKGKRVCQRLPIVQSRAREPTWLDEFVFVKTQSNIK